MTDPVDQEVDAIQAVLKALTPLSEKARLSVWEYVQKRLELPGQVESAKDDPESGTRVQKRDEGADGATVHIEELKDQKKPRSANEMAALVAYYLADVAPESDRKSTVDQKDIETHFKIAGFPLPQQVRNTLPNAKAAGYFDLAGDGAYKLNAVGHNLVAHSMPRGSGRSKSKPTAAKKRVTRSKSKATKPRKR